MLTAPLMTQKGVSASRGVLEPKVPDVNLRPNWPGLGVRAMQTNSPTATTFDLAIFRPVFPTVRLFQ